MLIAFLILIAVSGWLSVWLLMRTRKTVYVSPRGVRSSVNEADAIVEQLRRNLDSVRPSVSRAVSVETPLEAARPRESIQPMPAPERVHVRVSDVPPRRVSDVPPNVTVNVLVAPSAAEHSSYPAVAAFARWNETASLLARNA